MNFKGVVSVVVIALFASGCGSRNDQSADQKHFASLPATAEESLESNFDPSDSEILGIAELKATPGARKVLENGRSMINSKEIIIGSCWDYADAVYKRAGYEQRDRLTVFKSKKAGSYLEDASEIKPGDWLYFINHAFRDSEHSAIFVMWLDEEKKVALALSYGGGNKAVPAKYSFYELSSVYNIMRPNEPALADNSTSSALE